MEKKMCEIYARNSYNLAGKGTFQPMAKKGSKIVKKIAKIWIFLKIKETISRRHFSPAGLIGQKVQKQFSRVIFQPKIPIEIESFDVGYFSRQPVFAGFSAG